MGRSKQEVKNDRNSLTIPLPIFFRACNSLGRGGVGQGAPVRSCGGRGRARSGKGTATGRQRAVAGEAPGRLIVAAGLRANAMLSERGYGAHMER